MAAFVFWGNYKVPMPNYRRAYIPGATWFFTVTLLQRHNNHLLIDNIELLRQSVRKVKEERPFDIVAWVVLPEHLHCILQLPEGDSDFSTRWRLMKSHFSKGIAISEYRSERRQKKSERGIWQRRFWEHLIRDETDLRRHIDYIHVNPLKHGLVGSVADWPYSTFHRYVDQGTYPIDWCGDPQAEIVGDE